MKVRWNEEQHQETLFSVCGSHFAGRHTSSRVREGYAISPNII